MKRLLVPAIATLAFALSACGSDGSAGDAASEAPAAGTGTATVAVASVDGVGDVLVDSSGKALYTPDEEASGTVLCVDSCTAFWEPLEAGASAPTAAAGVPSLGVIDRPDGTKQVTVGGRPLYTFTQDSAGNVTGDGFSDDFGSQHFTWRVVHSDGATGSGPAVTTPTSPGGGYGY